MSTGANVFISYATDTKPLAEELSRELEAQGYEPWIDFKNLRPGQRWLEELDQVIDKAQWFVILVRPESKATAWQEAEWSAALDRARWDRAKRVLPVVFDLGSTPPFLRHWVALRVNSDAEASHWTHEVVNLLQAPRAETSGVKSSNQEEIRKRLDEVEVGVRALWGSQAEVSPASRNTLE